MTSPINPNRIALGANLQSDGACDFRVWAPDRKAVALHLLGARDQVIPMTKDSCGYHQVRVNAIEPQSRYLYQLDNSQEYPDPASRFQPDGVHKPSAIVDLEAFPWTDSKWSPPSLEETVFYELHVGTFSKEGSLDGVIAHLPELADLGTTTIELMPLAQFPGSRNWGYDGVYPFAVQNSYGGPITLQRLVDAAHNHGLAIALDVVYNHLGPEGNYFGQFGPYFTNKYSTPWGEAINYDGPNSGAVRGFVIENSLFWFEQFHIDVLRLDAVHGIFDFGALHLLAELQNEVDAAAKQLGRPLYLIAESDLNDARLLLPRDKGGYALPAQWSDDFHHSLHTLLTSEAGGYYADFGSVDHLTAVIRDGWYYHGQYSSFRRRRHGNCPRGISHSHFVVGSQNHDQIGNRARGERISTLISFEAQKLAAGVTLLSPFVPLLFMGEEYGELSPFLYFTSHGDKDLIDAVRRGRHEEFAAFGWNGDVPDPQDETTFANSRLRHRLREQNPHRALRLLYRELLAFRRRYQLGSQADWQVTGDHALKTMTLFRSAPGSRLAMFFNFSPDAVTIPSALLGGDWAMEDWTVEINSADARWLGPAQSSQPSRPSDAAVVLPPQSFVVFSVLGDGAFKSRSRGVT